MATSMWQPRTNGSPLGSGQEWGATGPATNSPVPGGGVTMPVGPVPTGGGTPWEPIGEVGGGNFKNLNPSYGQPTGTGGLQPQPGGFRGRNFWNPRPVRQPAVTTSMASQARAQQAMSNAARQRAAFMVGFNGVRGPVMPRTGGVTPRPITGNTYDRPGTGGVMPKPGTRQPEWNPRPDTYEQGMGNYGMRPVRVEGGTTYYR